ncbi:hypothetical protein BVX95_01640 [archaeon D22]|nr:hypothetical protein BVX95_01640 [archaeon D22]
MMEHSKYLIMTVTVIIVALLNFLTGVVANFLHIPFFLDTWATSLGTMTAGPIIGGLGGIVHNLIMAGTVWGWSAWVWMFSSIWIAFITWYFFKKGYLDISKPGKVLQAGLLIGLTNAIVTFLIAMIFFEGLPTYEGTRATFDAFLAATGSVPAASLLHHLVSELGDKTVSIFIAAIVFSVIPKKYCLSGK